KRVETVRFDTGRRPRPPFQLPLRIAAVGDEVREAVKAITPRTGLVVIGVERPEHLRDQPAAHIIVVRGSDLRRACRSAFRGQIGEDMPALVVVLGGKWPVCAAAPWAPAGAAVYALRRDHAFAALPMIIDNIAR